MADATGFTNGNNIGVTLNDGSTQWTTINGVPTGTTIPLAAALTQASSVNNFAFTYPQSATIQSPCASRQPAHPVAGPDRNANEPPVAQGILWDYPNKVNPGTPT